MPRDHDLSQLREARAVRESRDHRIEHVVGADRRRSDRVGAARPVAAPVERFRRDILTRELALLDELRRDDERLRELMRRIGRDHAGIVIVIGVAQDAVHDDQRARYGRIAVERRGAEVTGDSRCRAACARGTRDRRAGRRYRAAAWSSAAPARFRGEGKPPEADSSDLIRILRAFDALPCGTRV